MKTGSFWSWSLGVGLVALPLIGGCLRTVPPPKPVAATDTTVVETEPDITLTPPADAAATNAVPLTEAEDAAVRPLPGEFTLPPNVQVGKSLADLIRLAQSGTEEGVMLAFVSHSPVPFNPDADALIYLQDIGVPGNVVSAMLQRDEQLKGTAAANASAPVPAPSAAPDAVAYAAAPTAVNGPALPPESVPGATPADYAPEETAAPAGDVVYPDFYQSLAPYGSWMEVEGYGACWQPAVVGVNPGWQPYFHGGRWLYTDCGWYWTSDYTWGWAPFHYGRWFHHNRWGWCWKPDRVWGPAWVCWRHNDTHCGWAPLPPGVRFTAGVGLTGSLRPATQLSAQHFHFVEWQHFRDHNLAQHGLSREQGNQVYTHTMVTTHIVVTHGRVTNDGISPDRVATVTHVPVTRVSLQDVHSAGTPGTRPEHLDTTGRTLSVYRPEVAPGTVAHSATPGRVGLPKPLATANTGAAGPQNPAPGRTAVPPTTAPSNVTGPRPPGLPPQPSPPPYSFRATSRYYTAPSSTPAARWPENAPARFQAPSAPWTRGPQYTPSAAERSRHELPESPWPRVQGGAEAPRFSPPAVEHSRHEAAPVERPSRAEPAETHTSHAAPAAPSPAPSHSSSSSDRSDRSDHSDSGSHGRR